ncbi:MAG TPA: hypothetical protein VIV40_23770 [Kofleriaceae bacterium]
MLRPVTVLTVLATAGSAFANPNSIVPGGQDPDSTNADFAQKSVDVFTEIDYAYELDSSTIVRERVGDPNADPLNGVQTVRDLEFKQFRHTLTPRLQVGVFHDTFVTVALPIIIQQTRELRFIDANDRGGSSTVADGLVPMEGFDARDPGVQTPGDLLFRGPSRHGLDQVHLGLGTAFMNQQKDDTKPTWKMGADLRLSVGTIMKFDPMAPTANKGVSRGVHELKLWTTFARKLGWAEPWVELWWLVPVASKSNSLFSDPGFGATNIKSSQQAGVASGVELYALDNRADQTRISLDLGTKVVSHFEGREYTEMWEVFAFAGDSRTGGPLILDSDPTRPDVQALSHPGISNIENYLELTGRFAIRAQIGPHVRFAVIADTVWKTDHAISFADAGVDRDTDDNDLVNPGTDEVNPLHAQPIDLVGHRYRSEDGFDIVIGVSGQVLF